MTIVECDIAERGRIIRYLGRGGGQLLAHFLSNLNFKIKTEKSDEGRPWNCKTFGPKGIGDSLVTAKLVNGEIA